MLVTIIVLSVLLLILIIFVSVLSYNQSKMIEKAKNQGAEEFFNAILKCGFEKRVNDFKNYNQDVIPGGIVFVGDSLTENYNVYEFYKGLNVYNRGIGGDTTVGLLSRMDESIYALEPSIVVLLIGINDFELVENSTVDTIFENIKEIVKKIKENCPQATIILESLYPVNKSNNPKIDIASVIRKDNKLIDKVNEKIKDIQGVIYLDINSKLKDQNGEFILDYTQEGLHANTTGYIQITKILKDEINKILGE